MKRFIKLNPGLKWLLMRLFYLMNHFCHEDTAISRKIVGKNVHATIPKGDMGYNQYTVPDNVAVEPTFNCCFPLAARTYVHGLSCHSFKFLEEQ